MDLQEAIDAPSFHTQHFPSSFYPHGAHPKRLVVEGRLPLDVRQELERLGHDVQVTGDWANGQVCAVRYDPDSGLIGGGRLATQHERVRDRPVGEWRRWGHIPPPRHSPDVLKRTVGT